MSSKFMITVMIIEMLLWEQRSAISRQHTLSTEMQCCHPLTLLLKYHNVGKIPKYPEHAFFRIVFKYVGNKWEDSTL